MGVRMGLLLVERKLACTYNLSKGRFGRDVLLIYKSRQRLIFDNESIKLDVFSMREELGRMCDSS